jgi:hypothetical protein
MAKHKFLHCCKCDAVHHVSSFDKAPAYTSAELQAQPVPADDWRAFMDQHAGHRLEPLEALDDAHFPAGSPGDPMATAYITVSNGQREFLLRRSRDSIAAPVKFEPIEGCLTEDWAPNAEIETAALRKELRLRFRGDDGGSLSATQIELFIALFRAAVCRLQPRQLSAAENSWDNDNIAHAALPARAKDLLLEQCGIYFSAAEAYALRAFIEAQRAGSGVMTLLLRRRIIVAHRSKPGLQSAEGIIDRSNR